jgi:hypothetical protein
LAAWPQLARNVSEGWLAVRDDFCNWAVEGAA